MALLSQYAGSDKWESLIRKQDNIMNTRKWKGQRNVALESFVQMHRNSYVSMKDAYQHVDYQLPNKHTRVTYLLDALENDDAVLKAAMSSIKGGYNLGEKRTDFEHVASHLLPEDPVQKKRLTGKRPAADILRVTVPGTEGSEKARQLDPTIQKGQHASPLRLYSRSKITDDINR